jgi:hypothetical protein
MKDNMKICIFLSSWLVTGILPPLSEKDKVQLFLICAYSKSISRENKWICGLRELAEGAIFEDDKKRLTKMGDDLETMKQESIKNRNKAIASLLKSFLQFPKPKP